MSRSCCLSQLPGLIFIFSPFHLTGSFQFNRKSPIGHLTDSVRLNAANRGGIGRWKWNCFARQAKNSELSARNTQLLSLG